MTVQGHSYDDNVGAPVNRNLIINGGMSVAQRGTSTASITTTGYYTADRWTTNSMNSLFGTWTQSIENDAPTGSGHRKSLKMLITAGAGTPGASTSTWVGQSIEGQNIQHIAKGTSSAKQLTVQFWVKANVTGTYIFELYDVDNTRQVSGSYTILASATWEKKTIIIPLDTTGAFDNDNNNSMVCIFHLAAGTTYTSGTLNTTWGSVVLANRAVGQVNLAAATSNYWQVTGIQLEVGAVATPFEFEPFETTLRKCLRYFQRYNQAEARDFPQYPTRIDTTNRPCVMLTYQRKRASPTITVSNATHFGCYPQLAAGGGAATAFQGTLVGTFLEYSQIYFTAIFTAYTIAIVSIIDAAGYIDINAEL